MKQYRQFLPENFTVDSKIIRSKPFIALRGAAPQVLLNFLLKRDPKKRKTQHLYFTYSEANRLGITNLRFTTAIDNLLAAGFIEMAHQGGASKHDSHIFSLSMSWLNWKPGDCFAKRVKRGRRNGYKKSVTALNISKDLT